MLTRQLVRTGWFMDSYNRETQLSGFGKAVEVVLMAPDNLFQEAVERLLSRPNAETFGQSHK